jgi:hypothetical protein
VSSKDLDLDYRLVQPHQLPPVEPPQDIEAQVIKNTADILAIQHQVVALEENDDYLQQRLDRVYTWAEELGDE